jgi:hypothetical protein
LKFGIFAAAVIKKRRYWPKYILGELFKQHLEEKDIGFADAISGVLDEQPFNVSV